MSVAGATVEAMETDSEVEHMHTDNWDNGMPEGYWRAMGYDEGSRGDGERLAHLVYLDGLLVDCWTESPFDTAYAALARDRDAERRRRDQPVLPVTPPRPVHEQALEWLDAVAGGRSAVLALTTDPLPVVDMPGAGLALADRHRLEALWRHLEPLGPLFGDEALRAARALVVELWQTDRTSLTVPTVDRAVAGIVWVVARANDLFSRAGVTHAVVREALDLGSPLTAPGQALHRSLGGLPCAVGSQRHQDDLLPTGRAELLTSRTRARLVRLRDQALEASSVAAAS